MYNDLIQLQYFWFVLTLHFNIKELIWLFCLLFCYKGCKIDILETNENNSFKKTEILKTTQILWRVVISGMHSGNVYVSETLAVAAYILCTNQAEAKLQN